MAGRLDTIDLNLLFVLEALLDEQHVSAAAHRLGRSQPAISHSLKRLREHFDDPLLTGRGRTLVLTPLAEELVADVRLAKERLEAVFDADRSFDAAKARTLFRVQALFTSDWLPVLLRRIQLEAPNISVQVVRSKGRPSDAELTRRLGDDVDLAFVANFDTKSASIRFRRLCELSYSTLCRAEHPCVSQGLDARAFVASGHVLVTPYGGLAGAVDTSLERLDLQRRIVAYVPTFSEAAALLGDSDLLATMPENVARTVALQFGLVAMPTPVAMPPIPLVLAWHDRTQRAPSVRWLRGRLIEALRACGLAQ